MQTAAVRSQVRDAYEKKVTVSADGLNLHGVLSLFRRATGGEHTELSLVKGHVPESETYVWRVTNE